MNEFPPGRYLDGEIRFLPGESASPGAQFVLVFAFDQDRFVVADIRGRGWCIPSGRVEPGEPPRRAAARELWEEAGAVAEELMPFGAVLWERPDHIETGVAYLGRLRSLDGPKEGSEARDARLMSLEELRTRYFDWSAYYETLFRYASTVSSALEAP